MNPVQWISDTVPYGRALIEFIPISLLATSLFSMTSSLVSSVLPNSSSPTGQPSPYSQWQQQGSPAVTYSKYSPPPSPGKGGYQPSNNTTPATTQQSGTTTTQAPQRQKPSSRLSADPMGSEPVISLEELNNIEIKRREETERDQL